jgi:carboxypeptidase Q
MIAPRSLCSFVIAAFATAPAFAQSPPTPPSADLPAAAATLRDEAMHGSGAYAILRSLTVEVGPRSAGSEGDRAAVTWALAQMQDAGLDNVHAESVTVPHWERGSIELRVVEPYPQKLTAVALGGSIGTDENGLEAPVLEVADLAELASLPERVVRGTIVYFSARMERTRDGAGYVKAVVARGDGPSAASRRGAVAMLMRSAGTSTSRVAHTGATHYDPDVTPIPALALAHADADLLEEELASGTPVVAHLQLTSRTLPPARSANVIGEIRGSGEGIVLLGAHLDSWDLGTGAIDDGAGVAIVLASAKLLAARREQLMHSVRSRS